MVGPSTTLEPSSRRRSARLDLRLTILLSGNNSESQHFQERTETLDVSRYGARVRILQRLKVGNVLSLEQPDTGRSSQFRVVFQNPADPNTGHRETGIEFAGVGDFWGIQFPPDKREWGER